MDLCQCLPLMVYLSTSKWKRKNYSTNYMLCRKIVQVWLQIRFHQHLFSAFATSVSAKTSLILLIHIPLHVSFTPNVPPSAKAKVKTANSCVPFTLFAIFIIALFIGLAILDRNVGDVRPSPLRYAIPVPDTTTVALVVVGRPSVIFPTLVSI